MRLTAFILCLFFFPSAAKADFVVIENFWERPIIAIGIDLDLAPQDGNPDLSIRSLGYPSSPSLFIVDIDDAHPIDPGAVFTSPLIPGLSGSYDLRGFSVGTPGIGIAANGRLFSMPDTSSFLLDDSSGCRVARISFYSGQPTSVPEPPMCAENANPPSRGNCTDAPICLTLTMVFSPVAVAEI